MPLFDIEDETGRKFTLEGDSEPTEQELEEIFASEQPAASIRDDNPTVLEPYKGPIAGLFNAPPLPIGQAPLPQMDPSGMAFTPRTDGGFDFSGGRPPEESLLGTVKEAVMAPLDIAGRFVNAAASDLGATLGTAAAGRLDLAGEQGGNLLHFFESPLEQQTPTPQQKVLADISESNPVLATTGKIAGGVVSSLPLIALMPQGAVGKLIAAGFTADMISHAPDAARRLGEEMGKPESERNMDNLTTAISDLAQTVAFSPLAGAHAGGKVIGERVAPKAEAIRELAKQLKAEPASRPGVAPEAQRQLGIPLDRGENVLGTPELANLADRALQQGPNPPLARGDVSALEQIRRELNPPTIEGVEPTRVAERIEGGGEAPFGKVSFNRPAEAPTTPRTQAARAKKPEPPDYLLKEAQSEGVGLTWSEKSQSWKKLGKSVDKTQPPAEAPTTPTGISELVKLSPEDAADPRMHEPGITRKGKPNTINVQLRDLESIPVGEITVKPTGDPITDAANVVKAIREAAADNNRISIRESAGTSTDANGHGVTRYASSPNGPTWASVESLVKARKGEQGSLKLGENRPTNESVLEMPAEAYFDTAQKWARDAMAGKGETVQVQAELAALRDPNIQKWRDGYQRASQDAAAVKAEVQANPASMGDPAVQKRFGGAAQKAQFFSEGLKVLEGTEPNARTKAAMEREQALRVKTTEIAQPISLKDTAAEVSKFEQEFPGAPKINIAPDFTAMPKTAQDLAMSVGSDPRLIEAYVRGGEVWLNAEAVTSPAMVKRLALHETGGHWAVDRKLGKGLQRFMEQAHDSWATSETMKSVLERYPNADKVTLGREFIARLSENPLLAPKVWDRIVAQFRQWLRDAGFVKKVTENDIQALITGAVDGMRKVERGEATGEGMLSLKSAKEAANERFPEKLDTTKDPVQGETQNRKRGMGEILPDKPGVAAQKNITGGPERMRQSAARATTSESVPAPVQERIAEAPESFYKSQKYKTVEEAVAAAGDAELAAVPKDSNFHVASQLELSRRLFAQGKLEEGYNVFKAVSKQGTEWGQNINQFKMLKGTTPANIIDLVNTGLKEAGRDPLSKKQMEDLAKVADESIQANKNLETAKREWQKNPTDANAKKAQDLLDAANESDLKTQREMNRFKIKTWPQMLKTFAQGNPLTPISHVANFVGNTLGAAMEGSSRSVAALIDTTRAAMTSGERKVAVGPRGFTEASKGFGRGLKQAPGILAKGSGDTIKGESRAGLQPLRALAKAFAKNPDVPTVGGKVPINERIRLAVEGTFGIAPETMLRLLSAADKPAYEAARARLINEQATLKGIASKDLKMAQKFPELFFDKETLSQIKLESADAIFQRPSKAVNMLQNLIREKGGDWGDLAFTIFVSPYKLTPWNLVVRTLQYNPLIAAAKTAIEAGKGNTRAAEISAGRMVVGSILYGAGYYLYQNGLIGPSLEGRSESQKSRLLSGEVLPPNHVNVSGLKRASEGGDPAFQPGDETIDLTRGGGAAGAILSSVANIGRRMEKKPEAGGGELAASLVRDGVLEQANFTINQSFLKGVTGVLDAIQNGNLGPYINGVESMILNVGTPNTLTALSRATRENAPDMKTDTVAQEFGNVVKNRFGILGADDYLPTKRDLFGEPMPQTPEGRNAILYHLFDISKGRQVTDDPVKLELYRLWRRTASSEAIPSIPERQITVDKKTYPLPTPLYSRFAELVGKERKVILDEIVKNPEFNGLPDEVKISVLEKVYRAGAEAGKQKFLSESFNELKPLPERSGFKK